MGVCACYRRYCSYCVFSVTGNKEKERKKYLFIAVEKMRNCSCLPLCLVYFFVAAEKVCNQVLLEEEGVAGGGEERGRGGWWWW